MLFNEHGETFLVGGDRVCANSLHLLSQKPRPVPSPSRRDPVRVWRQIRSPPSACRDLYKHTGRSLPVTAQPHTRYVFTTEYTQGRHSVWPTAQTQHGSLRTEIYLSLERNQPLFLRAQLFLWVLGIRTRVLSFVQQTLNPRSHLPGPRFCLVSVLLSPTRWLFLASKQHSGTVTHTWHSEPRAKRAISHGARQRKGLCSQTDLVFHQAKRHLLTWPTSNNQINICIEQTLRSSRSSWTIYWVGGQCRI